MKPYLKNVKIFFLLARNSLAITLQGRVGAIFFLVGKLIRVIFIFIFITLLYSRTRFIKGYTLDQALLFYLTYNIVDTLSQILYREVYRFRPLIVSGSFDLILLKPLHPFVRVLLGGIDFLDLLLVIPYISVTIWVYMHTGLWHLPSLALYIILIFNSLLIATAFHIFVLGFGIVTTEVDHTIMIYRDITAMGRFPMEIYKEPIRSFFTFIIPVGIMMGIPAHALLRILTPHMIGLSFLISLGMLYSSVKFWKYALQKYQSWGG